MQEWGEAWADEEDLPDYVPATNANSSDGGYSENDYNYGQIKHLASQRIGKLKTEKRNSKYG
jgi:hypothetical protein